MTAPAKEERLVALLICGDQLRAVLNELVRERGRPTGYLLDLVLWKTLDRREFTFCQYIRHLNHLRVWNYDDTPLD